MNVELQRAIAVIVSKAPPLTEEQIGVINGVFSREHSHRNAPADSAPTEDSMTLASVADFFSRNFPSGPTPKRRRPKVDRTPAGAWPSGVYFVRGPAGIKIGVSEDPARRLNGLITGAGVGMTMIHVIPIGVRENWYRLEAALHAKWIDDRGIGEWFNETPRLVDFIDRLKGCESIDDQLRLCRES